MITKFLFPFVIYSFSSFCLFSQTRDSLNTANFENLPIKKSISPELIAWERMSPFGFNREEKTHNLRLYENLLVNMKSGVKELAALMDKFNFQFHKEGVIKKN